MVLLPLWCISLHRNILTPSTYPFLRSQSKDTDDSVFRKGMHLLFHDTLKGNIWRETVGRAAVVRHSWRAGCVCLLPHAAG